MGSVRASYCKGAIAAAKRHASADALLAAMAPARDEVRQASVIGWVDARAYLVIVDATLEVLGDEAAEVFWAERLQEAFRLPLLRPLVTGGLSLFGRHPGSLLRLTPQAYRLTYRGLGSPSVHVDEGVATLRIAGLPEPFRTNAVVHNFRGHAQAAVDHTGFEGSVEVERGQLVDGTLELRVCWG